MNDAYLHAIGLATICFARLEWDAVWCCEKISPGYISTAVEKTAGVIANDLVRLAAGHPDADIARSLGEAAAEFKRLVRQRNDLFHANPGTTIDGEQRLFRKGAGWTIKLINELADQFVAAGIPLNHHHHHVL